MSVGFALAGGTAGIQPTNMDLASLVTVLVEMGIT